MSDPFRAAQQAGEYALDQLLDHELDGGACGCTTCIVREVLEAAWPHVMQAAREEVADG